MSEELLGKFLREIDEEDGLPTALKKKERKNNDKAMAETLLRAANRGQVELLEEEQFLVQKKRKREARGNKLNLDDKIASKGYSLVDQMRDDKPRDLLKRNLKYMKYTEKRKLDSNKVQKMMSSHYSKLSNKQDIRASRDRITCEREPKKVMRKSKSVFSDKDFEQVKKKPVKLITTSDGVFL